MRRYKVVDGIAVVLYDECGHDAEDKEDEEDECGECDDDDHLTLQFQICAFSASAHDRQALHSGLFKVKQCINVLVRHDYHCDAVQYNDTRHRAAPPQTEDKRHAERHNSCHSDTMYDEHYHIVHALFLVKYKI